MILSKEPFMLAVLLLALFFSQLFGKSYGPT